MLGGDGGDDMARPRNQDERRHQLLEAASLAVADRGLSGLRLKHIADRAGLSIGSVLYYYPDVNTLLVEVHEQVVQRFYYARRDAIETESDPVRQLLVAVAHGVPEGFDDTTMRVIYELHVAAARDDQHAKLLTTLWEREVSLYEAILVRGQRSGDFELQNTPHAIAETVVALEDGFDLHLTGRNTALDQVTAARRILDYLALATGRILTPVGASPAERTGSSTT
jgi:AcrR family transcriptional regulator